MTAPHDPFKVINHVPSVKFANRRVILDEWWLIGGTPWTRTKFRLKHPIIYSKRGLRNVFRCFKQIFIKAKKI